MTPRERYRKLLNSARWHEVRAAVIARDCGLCRDCAERGLIRVATEVHHIVPVETAGASAVRMEELALDSTNLISLCHACHRERHRELRLHGARGRERRRYRDETEFDRIFGRSTPGGIFLDHPRVDKNQSTQP